MLAKQEVDHWLEELLRMSPEQRLDLPGMTRGREDVLPAGLLVLSEVMGHFGFAEVRATESDILDGIALSLDAQ
jgi:exopolyphosphatase/guanosine-5'-triphosphate,3'-diphosphate pyrophosphatase